jgi:hypothetical protein
MMKPGSKLRSRRLRKATSKIDVTAILTKSVKVGKQGREQHMTPFEVGLRALARKALKEQSLNAIRNLLEIALKYELVAPPPPPPVNGGVLVVPRRLTRDSWEALFKKPENNDKGEE